MMSLTNALTTAVNAVPMTTATARSTRFPRRMKARNSRSIGADATLGAGWTCRCSSPAPPARCRPRGGACPRCCCAAAATGCCSTAARARSASCCAPSACPTSRPSTSRTCTPTTGSACPACSSPSTCATATRRSPSTARPAPPSSCARCGSSTAACATRSASSSSRRGEASQYDGYEIAAFNVRHRSARLRLRDRRGRAPRPLRRRLATELGVAVRPRLRPPAARRDRQRRAARAGHRPERPGRRIVLSGDTAPVRHGRASPRTAPTSSSTRRRSPRRSASARSRPATAPRARRPRSRARPRCRLLALTHLSTRYGGARDPRRGARRVRAHGRPARLRRDRGPVRREGRAGARALRAASARDLTRRGRRRPAASASEASGARRASRPVARRATVVRAAPADRAATVSAFL